MGWQASVLGASGYAGGELLRLLARHPSLEVAWVSAGSNAGRPLGELHPQLVTLADRPLLPGDDPRLADVDVLFLALPHGESAAAVDRLAADDTLVIDLGADFRLDDGASWEAFYGGSHAGTWPYGLPELPGARAKLRDQKRIANPGCYPTAVALALAPLLAKGLAEPDDLVVVAASGTSGAGRAAKPNLLGSEVMGDLSAYKAGGAHQHIPEIRQSLSAAAGAAVTLSFTPVLAPMPRGILATCTARLSGAASTQELYAALAHAYADEPFVTVLPEGQWPHTASTLGSNSCHLQVVADRDAGRAVVVAAIDNLGKGAAGQALQNANLALGLPETTGLPIDGIAP
ncbi:MAG TPA: N-acetyl-gamma-glutamyl-phosphate reductase [Mycobacteriales bacterium]|jgi:N-acetyl-gamma-glutamyl-phosphate reductase|nr:N-acetyl-gamma-glutamyl-phosphate reductase [Mycobacteriales bacterium]